MKGHILLITSLCILLLATSCGITQLVASDRNTSIYVNSVLTGKGFAEVRRTGFPKRLYVETRRYGSLTGETVVKRKFTAVTAVVGIYTYGLGFLFTFQYPSQVFLPENKGVNGDAWERPYENSAWELPASKR